MAPLINEFKKHPDEFTVEICLTGQHREMLDQVNDFFDIKGDYDLSIMSYNQTLFDVTSKALLGIGDVLEKSKPDLVFVQGDTTTVFAGALASYYKQIKVAHLEAGLRSNNKLSPYPEEINRILTGHIADYHFAPTKKAKESLLNENINKNIHVVGNTVIDALFLGIDIISKDEKRILEYFKSVISEFDNLFNSISKKEKKLILVTGHRRESFGKPFENMCNAMLDIVEKYQDVELIYPVHLNPNVRKTVNGFLKNNSRIHLIEPLDYPFLIWLEKLSYLILTDSGGIQEEGPSLGKPVLVMRDVTERMEGVDAGTAKLVGTERDKIFREADLLISSKNEYNKMAQAVNPYGDGTTSKKIVEILKDKNLWK